MNHEECIRGALDGDWETKTNKSLLGRALPSLPSLSRYSLLQGHRVSSIPIFRYRFLSANHKASMPVHLQPINDSQRFSNPNKISQHVTPVLTFGLDKASGLRGHFAGERLAIHTARYDVQTKSLSFPGFTTTRDSRLILRVAGNGQA